MKKYQLLLHLLYEGFPFVLNNLKRRFAFKLGDISTQSGTCHLNAKIEESIHYIQEVFHDYKFYGGIDKFYGRIAEVGPGGSCGVGIMFLLDGCEKVDLIDKFYSARDKQYQGKIIQELVKQNPALITSHFHGDVPGEEHIDGLARYYGLKASAEQFFENNVGYDFIVSRAVLEHVDDPEKSISLMAKALNPNGMLLHKIDLRDHGMFTPKYCELTFLKIPRWYYTLMTHGSERPNRALTHRYKKVLERSGLEYKIFVTRLVGVDEIIPHLPWEEIDKALRDRALAEVKKMRRFFAKEFRDVEDKFLSIAGIFIVAKKVKKV